MVFYPSMFNMGMMQVPLGLNGQFVPPYVAQFANSTDMWALQQQLQQQQLQQQQALQARQLQSTSAQPSPGAAPTPTA